MSSNRRKSRRHIISRPGLIQVDTGEARMHPCMVQDISEGGSLLVLSEAVALPQEFTLVLSYGGGVNRRCQLVWRDGDKAGVRFVARQAAIVTDRVPAQPAAHATGE